jgi:hypothetical protein
MSTSSIQDIAAKFSRHHDAEEARRLESERIARLQKENCARSKQQEREVIYLADEVVAEVNAQLLKPLIQKSDSARGWEYRFGPRVLHIRFFEPGELPEAAIAPGLRELLRARNVVHGGYIEIKEGNEDREGWNLVLIRTPEEANGQWRIVESRRHALVAPLRRYEPFATEVRLFAENLSHHWSGAMHSFVLTDKPLERNDMVKMLAAFSGGLS